MFSWMASILFMILAGYCLFRTIGTAGLGPRLGHCSHGVMCVAMVLMVWDWEQSVLARPQIIFFGFAALGFAISTMVGLLRPVGAGGPPHAGGFMGSFHAMMMACMAWMAAAMGATSPTAAAHLHHHSGLELPGWGVASGLAFLVALFAGAARLVTDLSLQLIQRKRSSGSRRQGLEVVGDGIRNVAMTLGMVLLIIPMVVL